MKIIVIIAIAIVFSGAMISLSIGFNQEKQSPEELVQDESQKIMDDTESDNSIYTDKTSYGMHEKVIIFGEIKVPDKNLTLGVIDPDGNIIAMYDMIPPPVSSNDILLEFDLEGLWKNGIYTIQVFDGKETAETTFTYTNILSESVTSISK